MTRWAEHEPMAGILPDDLRKVKNNEFKHFDDARIIDEIKRPMQPPRRGCRPRSMRSKGSMTSPGKTTSPRPKRHVPRKLRLGLGPFPVPIIRRRD